MDLSDDSENAVLSGRLAGPLTSWEEAASRGGVALPVKGAVLAILHRSVGGGDPPSRANPANIRPMLVISLCADEYGAGLSAYGNESSALFSRADQWTVHPGFKA